jgi:hypothetical protein
VARRVAEALSSALARDAPANALRRKRRPRHPPACAAVQPGGARGTEGVLDARMARQPGADRATELAGELVGAEIPVATRRGRSEGVQQRAVPRRVARGRRLSSAPARRAHTARRRPRPARVRARHPGAPCCGGRLVTSPGPAGSGGGGLGVTGPRSSTQRTVASGGGAVERATMCALVGTLGTLGTLGTKSGSVLLAHSRVRRQRTPARRKRRRT